MISINEIFSSSNKLKFTIQEHLAERAGRHFDLRLEHEGAMESWATRKLDQLVDGDVKKIMLFQTEPHGMSWYAWEGKLRSGYGKGTVNLWDYGTYEQIKWDPNKSIIVDFNGDKIKGKYTIIPYKTKQKQETFLMFKSRH